MRSVPEFRFLTNHGNTFLVIARDPKIRIRDIAALLDITERAAQKIVSDLTRTGYVSREREGRRNVYSVRTDLPLHIPFQRDIDVAALVTLLRADDDLPMPRE